MGLENIDRPEDITGVGIARQVLGVDRNPPKEDIIRAFETRARDATGTEYWTLVKAREICLISGMKGATIYNILREKQHEDDISSLQDAQQLLDIIAPYDDRRELVSYNRVLKGAYEDIRDRLEELVDSAEHSITEASIQAVDICYYGLHFRDLQKGREYVLGSTKNTTDSSPQDKGLLTGWKYSCDSSGDAEYYISKDRDVVITVEPTQEESNCGFQVGLSQGDSDWVIESFSRYGDAKRQVKRWVIDYSEE